MYAVASLSVWAFVALCAALMIFIVTLVVLVAKRPGVGVKVALFKGEINIWNAAKPVESAEGNVKPLRKPVEKNRLKPPSK